MIAALLLATAPLTAIEAERAFEAEAHQIGQWAAFRKWATDDAVLFAPEAVWVQDYLKDAEEPEQALHWAPADSWVSCDGRTAINRGPWVSPTGKTTGYFTTVWMRQKEGWRWIYDGGDRLAEPMALPRPPHVVKASCASKAKVPAAYLAEVEPIARLAGKPPADAGQGRSADGTLIYEWRVAPGGKRTLLAKLWNGKDYDTVLDQTVEAPPKDPPKPQ